MSALAKRREREQAEQAEREAARRKQRLRQLGAIGVFAIVLVGALIIVSQGGNDSTGSAPVKGLLSGIDQDGTSLGDPQAPFTLVEFGDPQCPFCAEYDRKVFPTVVQDYVRPGKLRLEFRPLTFIGPDSETAARFAVALGEQNRFWNFIDLMYHNQSTENSGYVTPEFLAGLADQIPGADAKKASAAASSSQVTEVLDQAKTDAQDAGISSTPSFLIGPTGGPMTNSTSRSSTPDVHRRDQRRHRRMSDRTLELIARALVVVGLAIAGYLTWVHYAGLNPVCVGGGGGCERVQSSSYADVASVPVALLGLVGYALIGLTLLWRDERARLAGAALALVGFGFSLYLTYLELDVIDAICQWCVASAATMTALAAVMAARVLRAE